MIELLLDGYLVANLPTSLTLHSPPPPSTLPCVSSLFQQHPKRHHHHQTITYNPYLSSRQCVRVHGAGNPPKRTWASRSEKHHLILSPPPRPYSHPPHTPQTTHHSFSDNARTMASRLLLLSRQHRRVCQRLLRRYVPASFDTLSLVSKAAASLPPLRFPPSSHQPSSISYTP